MLGFSFPWAFSGVSHSHFMSCHLIIPFFKLFFLFASLFSYLFCLFSFHSPWPTFSFHQHHFLNQRHTPVVAPKPAVFPLLFLQEQSSVSILQTGSSPWPALRLCITPPSPGQGLQVSTQENSSSPSDFSREPFWAHQCPLQGPRPWSLKVFKGPSGP